MPLHLHGGHSGGVTDAWRKHRVGLWTLGVFNALLAFCVVTVRVSSDEDTEITVLLLSGALTLVGIVTGFVMLFRTLGTYGELSGKRWPKVAQVLAVILPVGLILLITVGPSLFFQ